MDSKKCPECSKEIPMDQPSYIFRPSSWPKSVPEGSFHKECAQRVQLRLLAEDICRMPLDGDHIPEALKKAAEPLHIVQVHKMLSWMRKGVGVDGGGDYIGMMEIAGLDFDIYMIQAGIYGKQSFPGYFFDNAGNWYRVAWKDLVILYT